MTSSLQYLFEPRVFFTSEAKSTFLLINRYLFMQLVLWCAQVILIPCSRNRNLLPTCTTYGRICSCAAYHTDFITCVSAHLLANGVFMEKHHFIFISIDAENITKQLERPLNNKLETVENSVCCVVPYVLCRPLSWLHWGGFFATFVDYQ